MTSYEEIEALYEQHNYRFFKGEYALNLFGIRRGYETVNEFNDVLGVAFTDSFGNDVTIFHEGTTKPGLYYLKNKLGGKGGTAILIPGQYLNCWKIGKHNGKYDALRQNGSVFKVWRDGDSDGRFDIGGKEYDNVTGLNMHTTSFINDIQKVGAYSAGCQVRQNHQDHRTIMGIIFRSYERWNNPLFSYTLFDA